MAIMSEEAIKDREKARVGGEPEEASTRFSSRRLHASMRENADSFKQGNSRNKLAAASRKASKKGASPKQDGSSPESAEGEDQRGMVLPFDPLALTFRDLHYYVDMPKVLLRFSIAAC